MLDSKNQPTVKLQFLEKSVYGKTLFYPQNTIAETIVKITGRKTLSLSELNDLSKCFIIETVQEYSFKTFENNKG